MLTTRTKSKGQQRGRKSAPKIPVPKNDRLIVLTGMVHQEAGGRQFAFCTAEQTSAGFFLGPQDMASPNGGRRLAAFCVDCKTEAGEPETHWIVDFKAALFNGKVDTEDGGYIVAPRSLIQNLIEAGPRLTWRKRATS